MDEHRQDSQSITPLVEALRSGEERLAIDAAKALGRIGDATAVPALLQVLTQSLPSRPEELPITTPDEWSAVAAAVALGKIGDTQAMPALLQVVRTDHWREQFYELVDRYSDAAKSDPTVILFLMAVREMISDLQCAAARALGEIRDERAMAGLIEALNDESDKWLRAAAAEALEKIGTPAALAALNERRQR